MDENTQEPPDLSRKKPISGKMGTRHWLTWSLTALSLLLLAGGGYLYWRYDQVSSQKQVLEAEKKQLASQVADLKAQDKSEAKDQAEQNAVADEDVQCNDTPTADRKENIKAALDSQNTAAFATYFSDPVLFVIAASEKGGNETPDQAAVDMEYANTATGPWDFNLPQATLDGYDDGDYTQYFDANTYTGRAASGQVAAFDFDCNGKIKQAFLSASEGLL